MIGPSLSGTLSILAREFKCYLLGSGIISKSFPSEGLMLKAEIEKDGVMK